MKAAIAIALVLAVYAPCSHANPAECQLSASATRIEDQIPDSREHNRELRAFFDRVNQISTRHDPTQVESCCASAGRKEVTASICSYATFIASGKQAQSLLRTAPTEKVAVQWLWRWDAVIQRTNGMPYPDGFASIYVDALFGAINNAPTEALDRVFDLYRFADGEHAEYIADRLIRLIEARPKIVLRAWPSVAKNRSLVERAMELYPDRKRAVADAYRNACTGDGGSACSDAVKLFDFAKS